MLDQVHVKLLKLHKLSLLRLFIFTLLIPLDWLLVPKSLELCSSLFQKLGNMLGYFRVALIGFIELIGVNKDFMEKFIVSGVGYHSFFYVRIMLHVWSYFSMVLIISLLNSMRLSVSSGYLCSQMVGYYWPLTTTKITNERRRIFAKR